MDSQLKTYTATLTSVSVWRLQTPAERRPAGASRNRPAARGAPCREATHQIWSAPGQTPPDAPKSGGIPPSLPGPPAGAHGGPPEAEWIRWRRRTRSSGGELPPGAAAGRKQTTAGSSARRDRPQWTGAVLQLSVEVSRVVTADRRLLAPGLSGVRAAGGAPQWSAARVE